MYNRVCSTSMKNLKGISLNNKPVIYDKSLRKKKQLSECIKPNLRWHEGEKDNLPRWNIHPRSSWLNIHEINFSIPGNNTVHGRAAEVNLANPWCRMKIRPFWSKHIYFFKRSTGDITWVQWNY